MKKVLVIAISLALAYLAAAFSGFEGNKALLVFGIVNAFLTYLGFSMPGKDLPKKSAGTVLEDLQLKASLKQILDNALHLNSALENIRSGAVESGKAAEEIAVNTQFRPQEITFS